MSLTDRSRRFSPRRVPLRWFGVAALVGALGISGFFHGLDRVPQPGPVTAAPSAPVTGGPWTVTVQVARVVDDMSPMRPETAGDRWFLVLATVEVTADESRNDIAKVIRVAGVAGLTSAEPTRMLLSRDATDVGFLNPGMPERIGFVWEQRAAAPVPTTARVAVYGMTYRRDSLSGRMFWADYEVHATVTVPVQDRRT